MPMFDFITEKDLRLSLEDDYAEMQKCVEGSAWKSVQVLAGSIVEALLVDYLAATPNPTRTPNNALRMDLADAIAICRTEKVLSDLIQEGQTDAPLFTLLYGWAFRFKTLRYGRRQILSFPLGGDFIGVQQKMGDASAHGVDTLTDSSVFLSGAQAV